MDTPIASLRDTVIAILDDCAGHECERMRARLRWARDAQELWLLRCDIFQLVASRHCQSIAAARINALLPLFEGLLPQRMLVAV